MLVHIYIDDIIFDSTNEILCKDFSTRMQQEFEMSLMGELNFFLGLHIKQEKEKSLSIKGSMLVNLWRSSRWKTQSRCPIQWVLLPNLTKILIVRM